MFLKKKAGKAIRSQMMYEIRCINKNTLIICIICVLIGGLVSYFAGGSPTYLLRMLKMPTVLPTRWFFKLVWTIMYILVGASLANVLSCMEKCKQIYKYRSGMLLIMMCIFNCIWYPLFFGAESIFLALMACAAMVVLTFFALKNIIKVSLLSTLSMSVYMIWILYLFFLNAVVLVIN